MNIEELEELFQSRESERPILTMDKEFLGITEKEICNLLWVSRKTIYRIRQEGLLSFERRRKHVIYNLNEIIDLLQKGVITIQGKKKPELLEGLKTYKKICSL